MKNLKIILTIIAATLVAAISIGASGRDESRPDSVSESQWIALNKKAGFALTDGGKNSPLVAELFVKTNEGWRRASIHNEASSTLISR